MDILFLRTAVQELGLQTRPVVPLEQIREWKAQLGACLPEDYVSFVTQIGDGWEKQVVKRSLWREMKSLSACGDLSLLREPFPYTDPWIWEDRETNPLPGESDEDWDRRVEALLRPTRFGNLALMRGDRGQTFRLILKGACAGEIWEFTDVGISPCAPRTAFGEWITAQLAVPPHFS